MVSAIATAVVRSVDLPAMASDEPREQLNVRVPKSVKKRLADWINSQTFPPQAGDVVTRALSDLLDKLESGELPTTTAKRPKGGK